MYEDEKNPPKSRGFILILKGSETDSEVGFGLEVQLLDYHIGGGMKKFIFSLLIMMAVIIMKIYARA